MDRIRSMVRRLTCLRASDDRGASAVEYGMVVAAIAAIIAAAAFFLGSAVLQNFQDTCQEVANQQNPSSDCGTVTEPTA